MSRHEPRQQLALEFGAMDIGEERGDEGVARIEELTGGLGAHSVIEVGRHPGVDDAVDPLSRPGGHVGYVGSPTTSSSPAERCPFSHVHLHGGPAPVRRFLPQLVDLVWNRGIDPGKVFDLALPLEEVAGGLPCHGRTPRDQVLEL